MTRRQANRCLAILTLLGIAASAHAFTATITSGPRQLFLQVGTGTMSGAAFSSGGTPANNATINTVSVTVPATAIGNGTKLAMTSDSLVANSSYDNFAFCTALSTVYVGGFYRNSATGNATLSATSPASLTNAAADTIAFSQISWTSSGAGDSVATIPSGTFNGGVQTLYTTANNRWFESCLGFAYANSAVVPAGTYSGRVRFTLSAP